MTLTLLSATGRCYRNAFVFQQGHEHILLVHGIITNPSGRVICHAWVEFKEYDSWFVADVSEPPKVLKFEKDFFYDSYKVRNVHRYTKKEALKTSKASGLYGPWDANSLLFLRDNGIAPVCETNESRKWIRKMLKSYGKRG